MSWNFILLIFINVCQVRWIVIIPGLTMSSPDGELRGSVWIIKNDAIGLARTCIALVPTPGADTEETGRYDLAWKICVVFWMLSK